MSYEFPYVLMCVNVTKDKMMHLGTYGTMEEAERDRDEWALVVNADEDIRFYITPLPVLL